ncbi:ABC transporter substrate-binding protein [Plastoroseomonas hellenica]|uniref:ABC transporter substrate-binding protein n=1 Tax=Plastoroseomonas hellenica TaxID=2687306 RepID=UPI001BA46DE6|nr:ABC transporter substrate-binding protein [Plastoroseomonas hellenica]MBR0645523.1 ABC transporter substrate-binding protein [Plastoroseomonas hellenica]
MSHCSLFRRVLLAAAAALPFALSAGDAAAQAALPSDRVLRVVPHADLRTLDPVAVSVTITRMHGLMIYETLFAWDSQLRPQPQMVESTTTSPDGLTWRFTLREGLRFHDGQPVTTRDVIASLRRWMARDVVGSHLGARVTALEAIDARSFEMRLSRPHGFVTYALGSAVGQIPAIMRAENAETDPSRPITTTIGSGPFRFNRDLWLSGQRVVYDRNPDYVPRREPADGLAGGRVVRVDRVEWQIMPDAATAAAALQTGEIDIWEQPALDLVPVLSRRRDIQVDRLNTISTQAMLRPNSLFPPFNDPRARLALAYATDQAEAMAGGWGDERWWRRCEAYFVCGASFGTEAGAEGYARSNLDRARELLREAGYNGERIVFITSTDIAPIGRMAEVAAASLRRIGMNIDLQVNDWGTVITRQPRRDPPDQGGWNLFVTFASGPTMQHPLTNIGTNMACDGRNWSGWPCDEEAERLRNAVLDAPEGPERIRLLDALHRRLAETQPYRVLGQVDQPYARRSSVRGMLNAPVMVFWNIEKSAR